MELSCSILLKPEAMLPPNICETHGSYEFSAYLPSMNEDPSVKREIHKIFKMF